MKRLNICFALLAAAMLSGCASVYPIGGIYTEMKLPVAVTGNNGKSPKVGTAECVSVLSMIATGDCSIEAAKKNGGITKVNHVDWEAKSVLGLFGNYKLIVHGE